MGSLDVRAVLLGLVTARLRIEFSFYKLVGKVEGFVDVWGVRGALCVVDGEGGLEVRL